MNPPAVASRPDGAQSRERLLHTALRLFAARGYQGTSTREIAQAAEANLSAIGYYFGDKAGLYRAAFTEPLGDLCPGRPGIDLEGVPLGAALSRFFAEFLEPLKRGEAVRLVMRLHFREMVEPTGVWADQIDTEIKPTHQALVRLLARELRVDGADAAGDLDLQRLAFSIIAMPVHYFVGQEIVNQIAPALLADPVAIDTLAARLALFAAAMIEAERSRRGVAAREAAASTR